MLVLYKSMFLGVLEYLFLFIIIINAALADDKNM